jgi:hypothetical protein
MPSEDELTRTIADAILGIDALWGGDVMSASGTKRFIADSWFSDEPLPEAYTHATAAAVRDSEGVAARQPDRQAIDAYLDAVDVRGAIARLADLAGASRPRRRAYLEGVAVGLEVMWDLAMEMLGQGEPVPYERCVRASTGAPPTPSDPTSMRERVRELLSAAGHRDPDLLAAADAWRAERMVPAKAIKALGQAFIAQFDALTARNVLPHLPRALHGVPRANVDFLPIEGAWFSGSMNYLGRKRRADGSPEYEATYEINAALQISVPEFQQLVSHEVVPGHVTTVAYYQNLYRRRKLGFEATVLTMNTRGAALMEGVANNAVLVAHGVREPSELPDRDLELGTLLALLQDEAKNQSSYLTWKENVPQPEVAEVLRREYLCSTERADKLSGAWGRHPLLGRMYLPCYRAGTQRVADLRRLYPDDAVLPVVFGCRGLADVVTVAELVQDAARS